MAASIDMRNSLRNYHVLVVSLGLSLLGCGSDAAGPAARSISSDDYWALRLNQHAITLSVAAPHNTIQLHAIPMTVAGTVIPNAGDVIYKILRQDNSIVVSSTGVVTAQMPSYQTLDNVYTFPVSGVVASLTINGVTLADTAIVHVTATAPTVPLQRISMQPPAESLALYQNGHWLLPHSARLLNVKQFDVNGDTVIDSLIYVRSSDANIGFVGSDDCGGYGHRIRCVDGVKPQADVTFYMQLWYYGVDVSDSLRVRIGSPRNGEVDAYETTPLESRDVQLYWWPTTLELTAPAEVAFINYSVTLPLDAIFDHPEHAHIDTARNNIWLKDYHYVLPFSAEGNIAAFYVDSTGRGAACPKATYDGVTTIAADSTCDWSYENFVRYRMFTKPGTYMYHTRFGDGGRIIIY